MEIESFSSFIVSNDCFPSDEKETRVRVEYSERFSSFYIQKLNYNGKWLDYNPDIFAKEALLFKTKEDALKYIDSNGWKVEFKDFRYEFQQAFLYHYNTSKLTQHKQSKEIPNENI